MRIQIVESHDLKRLKNPGFGCRCWGLHEAGSGING